MTTSWTKMRKKRKTECLILVLALLLCPASQAEAKTLEFPHPGFTLNLPQEWVLIPQEVFRKKMDSLQKAYQKDGSKMDLGYDYALQQQSRDWFEYPYILISVWEKTRVNSRKMERMNERMRKNLAQSQPGLTNNRLVHDSFDPSRHVFMAESRFELSGTPMVLLKSACYMDQGVVVFSAYMPQEMYADHAPDIKKALQTIELDPKNIYREHPEQGWSFQEDILPYMRMIIATVIVLLLAGLFLWKRRRGSQD